MISDLFLQETEDTQNALETLATELESKLGALDPSDIELRVNVLNRFNKLLHQHSPFREEPVGCVRWVKSDSVFANDYNPNSVAPPEMELLTHSITKDGYTQPIVTWVEDGRYEVIDGFHRHRVGKETAVKNRIHDYLPVVVANENRVGRSDRIAATIRHNRAGGSTKLKRCQTSLSN